MVDERKNVIESIANFKLQNADKTTSNTNAAAANSETLHSESIANAAPTQSTMPEPVANTTTHHSKAKFALLITCLLLSVALLLVTVLYQPGSIDSMFGQIGQVDQADSPAVNNEAQLLSLKGEIHTLQQTMNSISSELQMLSTVKLGNNDKQQKVSDFLATKSGSNSNVSVKGNAQFNQQIEQIKQAQLDFQKQQQQQMSAIEMSVQKLQVDNSTNRYANKIERWQDDVENIKSQQLKINGLLLELQKEYIKINQTQVNKVSGDFTAAKQG